MVLNLGSSATLIIMDFVWSYLHILVLVILEKKDKPSNQPAGLGTKTLNELIDLVLEMLQRLCSAMALLPRSHRDVCTGTVVIASLFAYHYGNHAVQMCSWTALIIEACVHA